MKVTVKYKCRCMVEEVALEAPARAPALDVVAWLVDIVTLRIARDHRRRSPACRATTMVAVKLPHSDAGVGLAEPPSP